MTKKRAKKTVAPRSARVKAYERRPDEASVDAELDAAFAHTFDATVEATEAAAPATVEVTEAAIDVAFAASFDATPSAAEPAPAPQVVAPKPVLLLDANHVSRMAATLFPLAVRLHRDVPAEAQTAALAALDGFLAQPSPSAFMRATRELRGAITAHRFSHATRALSGRAFGRALDRLNATDILDEERRGVLASLPVDVRAARRLDALAALLQAHDELATRVRAPQKYKLEPLPPEPKARHVAARTSPPKKRRRRR
jgi:hypothetical protein